MEEKKPEKLSIWDGLPPRRPEERLAENKSALLDENSELVSRYFPQEVETKYKERFKLFDRNNDDYITYP